MMQIAPCGISKDEIGKRKTKERWQEWVPPVTGQQVQCELKILAVS
jgi:hypothetical protein